MGHFPAWFWSSGHRCCYHVTWFAAFHQTGDKNCVVFTLIMPLKSFTFLTDYCHPSSCDSWVIVISHLSVVVESWIFRDSAMRQPRILNSFFEVCNHFWYSSSVSFWLLFCRLYFNSSSVFSLSSPFHACCTPAMCPQHNIHLHMLFSRTMDTEHQGVLGHRTPLVTLHRNNMEFSEQSTD